ncbi:hypothetical protein [Persephonella sp.]
MRKKVSFLPAFFIWGAVYTLIEIIFNSFNIQNPIFLSLEGGYDLNFKIVAATIFQTAALTGYFVWIFKESVAVAILKSASVSIFLYVFIYILLTGMYMDI